MEVNEENISKILSVLAHPLRRHILLYLSEKKESAFTDFATAFVVDTGKLSFHLRTLEAFVEQTQSGRYRLSRLGRNAIVLIQDVSDWDIEIETKTRPLRRPLARGRTRVGAFLVDFLIIFTLFLALSNVFYPFTRQFVYDVNIPFFLVLFWSYSTIFEGFRGQTLGKRLTHTKVTRIDGKDPSVHQAAIRNFGKAFLLPFDLAFGLRQKDRDS
jgi:DNA-binding transcriptional ArsR family regulator